jgi:epoxyqueuosine reductase
MSFPKAMTITSAEIKAEARRVGFDLVGIAPALTPTGFDHLHAWIERGYAGEMEYIPRREEAYEHPRGVLDGVRSVVVVGLNYRTADPPQVAPGECRVARYAWGAADYHDVIKERLKSLAGFVHERHPGCRTRAVVDTAPLLERDFARLAGLGWFGKNTMLLSKHAGSFFFLAALLTDVELEPDAPHETSHCGTCTRCLDACPTDAFPKPGVLDARRCISYLTIELRSPIPTELRPGMGDWLFGCDVCQDVCPWNRKAPLSNEPAFQPMPGRHPADAAELLTLDEAAFRERFRHTPLARPKRAGLLRNAAIVLGNTGDPRFVPVLVKTLDDGEPLIRGAAAWALGRIGGESATEALRRRAAIEDNPDVRAELDAAAGAKR